MVPRAGKDPWLMFRHVATVDGRERNENGLRLPIVWNDSSKTYMFRWPNKTNPRHTDSKPGIEEEFGTTPVLSTFGVLDSVLVQALNAAKGGPGGYIPELSVAPSATEVERLMLGV
jgi:hypothetical protein